MARTFFRLRAKVCLTLHRDWRSWYPNSATETAFASLASVVPRYVVYCVVDCCVDGIRLSPFARAGAREPERCTPVRVELAASSRNQMGTGCACAQQPQRCAAFHGESLDAQPAADGDAQIGDQNLLQHLERKRLRAIRDRKGRGFERRLPRVSSA